MAATEGAAVFRRAWREAEFKPDFLGLVLGAGLPRPLHDVIPEGVPGAPEVDFLWPAARLVVELDGHSHGMDDRFEEDRRRDRTLAAVGWRVVRFTWTDIYVHPERTIGELRGFLGQLAA